MSDKFEKAKKVSETIGKGGKAAFEKTKQVTENIGKSGKELATNTMDSVIAALDQDGDGQVDSTDIILLALKVPGVKIKREAFLRKELMNYCKPETIEKAIKTNPMQAGIDLEIVDKIANDIIKFERNAVSGISTVLGMPGGVAMVATIPADIAQYYGYMLRAAQKMLYLYGFPELNTNSEDGINLDTATINSLTVCLGIMYCVAGANNAIKAMAKALSSGVEKQLLKKALTKGTIYPIVKSVAKWFGKSMTKEVFASFFKKAIPVAGGVVGGGLTFATFKPCCDRLKRALRDTTLSNPNHVVSQQEQDMFEDIQNEDGEDDIN